MQLIDKSRKIRQEQTPLRDLHGAQKIQYIWDYYKLPLALLAIVLYVIVYILYRHLTYKDTILYTALVNVNAGETLTEQLAEGFLEVSGIDTSKNKLHVYADLYLTDDENNAYHEYTYASRMKILASIDGELFDVVLMNQEAFDAFSQNGYLCNLDELLADENPDFYNDINPFIVNNIYIEEDNSFELIFDSSIPYNTVSEEYPMGLDLSQARLIKQAGFGETVYFGIIENSPRKETAVAYLKYLFYGE